MSDKKKKLVVNVATCDMRNVTEEAFAPYDSITISAACVFSNARVNTLMARHNVQLDASDILSLPDGAVSVSCINGVGFIAPGQKKPENQTFLMVNGELEIAPGSEELLKSYIGMQVNGVVIVPESLSGMLSSCKINGEIETYPDDCIHLKDKFTMDHTFPLRAKQDAHYYAARRIVALEPNVDFGKLAEKSVRFFTPQAFITESLAEVAVPLFDEKTKIEILPDGCAFVKDDLTLDESTLRLYGGKLYVYGDVSLLQDGPWLDKLTYLHVRGAVQLARGLEDRLSKIGAKFDEISVVGGLLLKEKSNVELTCALLESATDGLSVIECGVVTVAEDVSPALLQKTLVSISQCGSILCTSEQAAVIYPVAQDCGSIGAEQSESEEAEDADEAMDIVQINGANYTF